MSAEPVTSVMNEQRELVLRVVRVLLWISLPIFSFYFFTEPRPLALGCMVIELAFTLVALITISSRAPTSWKGLALVAMMMAYSICGITAFGPTMGSGLFLMSAMIAAAFFLERRGIVAVFALLTLGLALAATLAVSEVVHPVTFAPDARVWSRMVLVVLVCMGSSTYAFRFVLERMRDAIRAERTARDRERLAQLERGRALRAMEVAQRLEGLGRLAGGVAHDINNALVMIQGGLDQLRASPRDEEILAEVTHGIERASATARQLMAFARDHEGELGRCQPGPCVARAAQSTARLLPPNVKLEVSTKEPTSYIGLSAAALEQVIINLILNARDALPRGGVVRVLCREDERGVVIEVRDDGVGMRPEVRARVFEPFFTTKGERGTGLGLAMVWGVTTRAGGAVAVESELGQGTTVVLVFPPCERAEEVAEAETSGVRPTRARVLLLEDEAIVARMMARTLARAELEVKITSDVASALDALSRDQFDVLITDGRIPDGPIKPVIRAFRAVRKDAPVILCSGFMEAGELAEEEEVIFIAKPFAPNELLRRVSRALATVPSRG